MGLREDENQGFGPPKGDENGREWRYPCLHEEWKRSFPLW